MKCETMMKGRRKGREGWRRKCEEKELYMLEKRKRKSVKKSIKR